MWRLFFKIYCYLYLYHQKDEQDLCFSVMAPNDRWALALKGKYTHPQLSSSGSQCLFLKPLQLFCQLALELREFGAFVGHIWVKERALGLLQRAEAGPVYSHQPQQAILRARETSGSDIHSGISLLLSPGPRGNHWPSLGLWRMRRWDLELCICWFWKAMLSKHVCSERGWVNKGRESIAGASRASADSFLQQDWQYCLQRCLARSPPELPPIDPHRESLAALGRFRPLPSVPCGKVEDSQ